MKITQKEYERQLNDLIGKRHFHLEVIDMVKYGRKCRLIVRCDCGNIREFTRQQFTNPSISSCGCMYNNRGSNSVLYKNGMGRTRIAGVYRDMISRCYNESDISYKNYGSIGITVCSEWKDDFQSFYNWAIKNGYNETAKRGECTLDRIKTDKGYSPDNCRWVSMKVQSNNKRNNLYYTVDGQTKTLSEWCVEYGLCFQSVYLRLKKGMDIKTALTKPMQKKKKDMTPEEIEERKQRKRELDKKWKQEHKEKMRESRERWKKNNPEKAKESWQKYNKKRREQKSLEKM